MTFYIETMDGSCIVSYLLSIIEMFKDVPVRHPQGPDHHHYAGRLLRCVLLQQRVPVPLSMTLTFSLIA